MIKKKEEHKKNSQDSVHSRETQFTGETTAQEQSGSNVEDEIVSNETDLENKIADLTAGLAASNDKYLRLSAEFDNFRKRTLKEKMDLMKNASEYVIVSFLPVIDDVERAIKAIETSNNLETTKEGINLIYNKFKDFSSLIDNKPKKIFLRDFLDFKKNPIDINKVEPIESIMKRFATGAMSFGAISKEAHEAMALAMNKIGGKSNTGEGGEDSARFHEKVDGVSLNSAIKQVAS